MGHEYGHDQDCTLSIRIRVWRERNNVIRIRGERYPEIDFRMDSLYVSELYRQLNVLLNSKGIDKTLVCEPQAQKHARKIIQMAIDPDPNGIMWLIALCDDGTMWGKSVKGWEQIKVDQVIEDS